MQKILFNFQIKFDLTFLGVTTFQDLNLQYNIIIKQQMLIFSAFVMCVHKLNTISSHESELFVLTVWGRT